MLSLLEWGLFLTHVRDEGAGPPRQLLTKFRSTVSFLEPSEATLYWAAINHLEEHVKMPQRIALVNMPFFTVYHPCLALGLLKAALCREGIHCDVHYINLSCAEWLGLSEYNSICHTFTSAYNALLGEWIFSKALFAEEAPQPRPYIQQILGKCYGGNFSSARASRLLELRDTASDFLSRCLSQVDWAQYEIVGFTSSFQQNVASLALAKLLRNQFPRMIIVVGGANCEGEMGLGLLHSFPFLDAVFSGEAEITLPRFVRQIDSGDPIGPIDGIFHRVDGPESIPTTWVRPTKNLDELPYPDYDDYFDQIRASPLWPSISGAHSPQVVAETSRGCWWGVKSHCTFCGLNGSTLRYRSKSPSRALEELLYLHERYGCFLQVVDNILDLGYFETLFPALVQHKVGMHLFYETKVSLSKQQLSMLKDSGIVAVGAGIESLSTQVLRLMHKGCSALQNVQFLKWCRELGIEVAWNLIWGFPGERPEEYESMSALVDVIRHLTPPMAVAKLQLHRFSPYFLAREAMGITQVQPHPAYSHVFPFPREEIAQLAYYFIFEYLDERQPKLYAAPLLRKLRQWQHSKKASYLVYIDDGESLTLLCGTDPHALAAARVCSLERKVYLFCDEIRTFSSVHEFATRTGGPGIGRESLRLWLDRMVARGFMIKENECYLSVAVRVSTLPGSADLPLSAREEPGIPELGRIRDNVASNEFARA